MAAPLTLMRPVAAFAFVAGSLASFAGAASAAEPLNDPTRNPLLGRGDDVTSVAPVPVAPPSRLQMIVRGPGETRSAVIDGTKVGVGDTLALRGGSARVERITDTTVVLARGGDKETLQLLPGAERAVRCLRRDDTQRPGGC